MMVGKQKTREPFGDGKRKFLSLFLLWRLNKNPEYGYSLISEFNNISIGPSKPSTIYLMLSKLEKMGLVHGEKKEVDQRVRKLYKTTEKGRALLKKVKDEKITGKLREFMAFLLE